MLGKKELPRLEALRVKRDDCFEGFTEIDPHLTQEEFIEAEIVIVTYMVDLLRTFLGETLLLRLVHDLWPNASFDDPGSGKDSVV